MIGRSVPGTVARGLLLFIGVAAASYGAYAAITWTRYGPRNRTVEPEPLLDRFMPVWEAGERHTTRVAAPAEITLQAAKEMELDDHAIVRAIFKAREIAMGADSDESDLPRGIVEMTRSLGWGVLAEVPGREIVMGAVTRPWEADVTFRALPPEEFAGFDEPGYVKIVWNLRAEPAGDGASIYSTETRAIATDEYARSKFRRYWSFVSPGIWLIRWASLGPLRREAERRASG